MQTLVSTCQLHADGVHIIGVLNVECLWNHSYVLVTLLGRFYYDPHLQTRKQAQSDTIALLRSQPISGKATPCCQQWVSWITYLTCNGMKTLGLQVRTLFFWMRNLDIKASWGLFSYSIVTGLWVSNCEFSGKFTHHFLQWHYWNAGWKADKQHSPHTSLIF